MGESLEHLLSWVKPIAASDDTKRIEFIFADHWIGYTLAKEGVNKLEMLFNFPKRQRMPNLLIVGPTNNGKSKLVQYFYFSHSPLCAETEMDKGIHGFYKEAPVLYIQMPPHPDIKRFYAEILRVLNVPTHATERLLNFEVECLRYMKTCNVKMLIIDEIHNLLTARKNQEQELLCSLRYMGNDLQIPIVALGTKEAYLAIRTDPQLENRFEPYILPLWKKGEEYNSLLASFVAIMPLKKKSPLTNPKIANKILEMSEGIIGEIATIILYSAKFTHHVLADDNQRSS